MAFFRSVLLVLMVVAWAETARSATQVFVLASGEKVEGELLFVSRDEVLVSQAGVKELRHIPMNQFTQAQQAALNQWGRTKMARWTQVGIQFSSGKRIDRPQNNDTGITWTYFVGKIKIQNRSSEPLQRIKAVYNVELDASKGSSLSQRGGSYSRPYKILAAGDTLESEVFRITLKEEQTGVSQFTTKGKVYSKLEDECGIKSLRVYVYVGTELIWQQRVK